MTDRRTGITKLIGVFLQLFCANTPKVELPLSSHTKNMYGERILNLGTTGVCGGQNLHRCDGKNLVDGCSIFYRNDCTHILGYMLS
jgi:hypothetical protein